MQNQSKLMKIIKIFICINLYKYFKNNFKIKNKILKIFIDQYFYKMMSFYQII